MKTFKIPLTFAALSLATLLTGCATQPDIKASFLNGDEVVYGRVAHIWEGKDMQFAHNILCGTKYPHIKQKEFSGDAEKWTKDVGFCASSNLDGIKQIRATVGVVNANGDMFGLVGFVPKDTPIGVGDIVEIKAYPTNDGRFRRPSEILRIAAKAKDATKENGCYWDAGPAWLAGFNIGGAICEGWHWKDHPFSNPSLLKK